MRTCIRWMGRKPVAGVDRRLDALRKVLEAARSTQGYQDILSAGGFDSPESIDRSSTVQATLDRFAPTSGEVFQERIDLFHAPEASKPHLQPFHFPFEPVPRTAILMPGFEQAGNVRVFASDWKSLERFRPEAIAAPPGVLRHLATTGAAKLSHALIVLTSVSEGPISEDDRDLFWHVFQVPIFEQLLGFDGRVFAWECEAHAGLHILPEAAILEKGTNGALLFTSLTDLRHPALRVCLSLEGRLEDSRCECGDARPRLLDLRLTSHEPVRVACAADCPQTCAGGRVRGLRPEGTREESLQGTTP